MLVKWRSATFYTLTVFVIKLVYATSFKEEQQEFLQAHSSQAGTHDGMWELWGKKELVNVSITLRTKNQKRK